MAEVVAILGASSGIGVAVARRLAADGARLVLAGRDLAALELAAKDLAIRFGAEVRIVELEALDFDSHEDVVAALDGAFAGGLDGVILVYGEQADQEASQSDFSLVRRMIDVNYASALSLFELLATRFTERRRGYLCAVTSVAGDRGRASNYHYGSTKAALSTALSGLRARVAPHGVRVTEVRPGFVDTQLTWGKPGVFLCAEPEAVAQQIVKAVRRGRRVVYTPGWWRVVMCAIRAIPHSIFERLRL